MSNHGIDESRVTGRLPGGCVPCLDEALASIRTASLDPRPTLKHSEIFERPSSWLSGLTRAVDPPPSNEFGAPAPGENAWRGKH